MRVALIIVACLFPVVSFAWPWSTDMMNQPSIKPQEGVMKPFPKRSIPVTGVPTKVADREEAKSLMNPYKPTPASLKTGKNMFQIYCAACHGRTGKADSPISPKIGAIALNDSYVQETLTEGWLFGTITFGSYFMPAYGTPARRDDNRGSNDLTVEERWHVVNYVKYGLMKDAESESTRTAAAN